MEATPIPHCRQCISLRDAGEVPATCGDCGAQLYARPVLTHRVGLAGMLRDLIALRDYFAHAPGPRSNTAVALEVASSGVFGTGNRGTKGAGAHVVPEPQPTRTPPSTLAALTRYRQLDAHPGHRARALIVAGTVRGDGYEPVGTVRGSADPVLSQGVVERVEGRMVTLQQALGWHLSREHHATWRIKLATRDTAPALAAMERIGQAALEAAVREWEGA